MGYENEIRWANESDLLQMEERLCGYESAGFTREVRCRRQELAAKHGYEYPDWFSVWDDCIDVALESAFDSANGSVWYQETMDALEGARVWEQRTPTNWLAMKIANMHHEEYEGYLNIIPEWIKEHPLVEGREERYREDLKHYADLDATERSLGRRW